MLRTVDRREHGWIKLHSVGEYFEATVVMDRAERDVAETVNELCRRTVQTLVHLVRDVRREQRHDQKPAEKDTPDQRQPFAERVDAKHACPILNVVRYD